MVVITRRHNPCQGCARQIHKFCFPCHPYCDERKDYDADKQRIDVEIVDDTKGNYDRK